MVRPNTFVVLQFKFGGLLDGQVARLAPLKILSTQVAARKSWSASHDHGAYVSPPFFAFRLPPYPSPSLHIPLAYHLAPLRDLALQVVRVLFRGVGDDLHPPLLEALHLVRGGHRAAHLLVQ